MTGYIREQKVKHILVDGGLAVNIMPKSTTNELGITIEQLSKSRMMIQGFSLESQRAIGMIRLEITMGDLLTSSIFCVIDSKTSYKLLLGSSWLHEHGIVAFTSINVLSVIVVVRRRSTVMSSHLQKQNRILPTLNSLKMALDPRRLCPP